MRRNVKSALALAAAMAFVIPSVMPVQVLAAGANDKGVITIVEGSNGTIVEADEQLASVTLQNNGSEAVSITEYNLGVTSSVSIPAGDSVTISAPDIYAENGEAYKLAVISDGVEVPMESGSVTGDISVAIVKGVQDYYVSHGQETVRWITCVLYADENGVDAEHSLLPMVEGVKDGDSSVKNVSIVSNNDMTAAIRSGGSGSLDVEGANITLVGDGGDDFTGIGSALGAADTSTLNVKDTTIYTSGIIRCAIFAGDEATLNLKDSSIDCEPGEYQSDVSISTAGMASPPSGLGIWGNCRAMNLVDSATVSIDNCEIVSQNWGALGVDDVSGGHLNVSNSNIVIKEQGYGAYSIGNCVDVFENCTFDVNYGVIAYAAAGDGSEIHLQGGSVANSLNYYGFVAHQSFNGLNSIVEVTGEGTQLNAGYAGIIAKGRGADITISDGALVTAKSGVLVRAQINDDTGAGSMDGTEVVNVKLANVDLTGDVVQGMGAPHEEASGDASAESSAEPSGESASGDASGDAGPQGPMGPMGPGAATNSITESVMNVELDAAKLNGAISSAELTLAIEDGNISQDNITDVGVVTDTKYTSNEFAVLNVSLENGSVWTVSQDSYLMGLTIDDSSSIEGGYVYVNGEEIVPEAGVNYSGEILVSTTQLAAEEPQQEASAEATAEAAAEEGQSTGGMSAAAKVVIALVVICAGAVAVFLVKKK